MKKTKRKFLYVMAGFLLLLPIAVFAGNSDFKEKNVYVGPAQIIDGNYLAAGQTVTVEGTVNGDVIVAGSVVNITGSVAGDVIAAGRKVEVSGPVQGDVRVFADEALLSGITGKNTTVFARNVLFTQTSAVGWGAMILAGNLDFRGAVAKDLRAAVGAATINGSIDEDLQIKVGESDRFVVLPGAYIGGDLSYVSEKPAEIMGGAQVIGDIIFNTIKHENALVYAPAIFFAFKLLKLICLLILGAFLIWLFPKRIANTNHLLQKHWKESLGWGLLAMLLIPVVIALLFMTGIGALLALWFLSLYVIVYLYAIISVSTCFGEWVLKRLTKRYWRGVSLYWSMVLGLFIYVIVGCVPLLGCLVLFLAVSAGMGAVLKFEKHELKRYR